MNELTSKDQLYGERLNWSGVRVSDALVDGRVLRVDTVDDE